MSKLIKYTPEEDDNIARFLKNYSEQHTFTDKEYPLHLIATKGYVKTLETFLSLKSTINVLFHLPNGEDLTPIECLLLKLNVKHETDLKHRKKMLILMFTSGGLTFTRHTKSRKNIFQKMREEGNEFGVHAVIEALKNRMLRDGPSSIMPQSHKIQMVCIDRVRYLMNTNMLAKCFSSGRWIFYEKFMPKRAIIYLKRPKSMGHTGDGKDISRRHSHVMEQKIDGDTNKKFLEFYDDNSRPILYANKPLLYVHTLLQISNYTEQNRILSEIFSI